MKSFSFWTIVRGTGLSEFHPMEYSEGYPALDKINHPINMLRNIVKFTTREEAIKELIVKKRMFPSEHYGAGVAKLTVSLSEEEIPDSKEMVKVKFEKTISKLSKEEQEFIRGLIKQNEI